MAAMLDSTEGEDRITLISERSDLRNLPREMLGLMAFSGWVSAENQNNPQAEVVKLKMLQPLGLSVSQCFQNHKGEGGQNKGGSMGLLTCLFLAIGVVHPPFYFSVLHSYISQHLTSSP